MTAKLNLDITFNEDKEHVKYSKWETSWEHDYDTRYNYGQSNSSTKTNVKSVLDADGGTIISTLKEAYEKMGLTVDCWCYGFSSTKNQFFLGQLRESPGYACYLKFQSSDYQKVQTDGFKDGVFYTNKFKKIGHNVF